MTPGRSWRLAWYALAVSLLPHVARAAEPAALSPCVQAIRQAEADARLPPGLLNAIGLVESGRAQPGGRFEPWPWSVNVAGVGAQFGSKDAAVAAVQAAWHLGIRSIDVGCMQVNLQQHPDAFASLDDAFDPARNAGYAAGFLVRLFGQTRDWGNAAGAYHSQTPELGDAYRQKVAAWWPAAGGGHLVAAIPTARTVAARIDPYNIYTPEFRARLAQEAADRARLLGPAGGRVTLRSILAPPRRAQFAEARQAALLR